MGGADFGVLGCYDTTTSPPPSMLPYRGLVDRR
jgi:hypothetical protein